MKFMTVKLRLNGKNVLMIQPTNLSRQLSTPYAHSNQTVLLLTYFTRRLMGWMFYQKSYFLNMTA